MTRSKVKKYIWPVSGVIVLLVLLTVALLFNTVFSTECEPDLSVDLFEIQQGSTFWDQTQTVDIFKLEYKNGGGETVARSEDGSTKIIAPGTSDTYSFELKNNGGVAADYLLDVEVKTDGLPTGAELPLEVRFRGPGGFFVGKDDEWETLTTLSAIEDSQTLAVSNASQYTLDWRWPFEGNDELDTLLGNASAENPVKLTISFHVYSEYHPEEAAAPVYVAVPRMLNGSDHIAYFYGDDRGMIMPEKDMTRAQVAAVFYRLLKDEYKVGRKIDLNVFSDMPHIGDFDTAIATLADLGILHGYEDGSFRPDNLISRAEFLTVCSQFADNQVVVTNTQYKDIKGHWAEEYIKLCAQVGWVFDDDRELHPNDNITRAEAAALINRMLHRMPKGIDSMLPEMKRWPDNMDENKWYYIDMQEASNGHLYYNLPGTFEVWRSLL